MKIILTLISQFVLSYVFGFIVPYFGGIGNGLELIAIPIGMALGVIVGGRIQYPFSGASVGFTALGSFVGILPLMIPGIALGFIGIVSPFIGSAVGFYAYHLMKR